MGYLRHEKVLKAVGDKIRTIRKEKGISQEELAFRTNIERSQIARTERGELNTSLSTLYEISLGLEVDFHELFLIDLPEEGHPHEL